VLIVKSICGGREGTGREGSEGGREGGRERKTHISDGDLPVCPLFLLFYTFTEYLE